MNSEIYFPNDGETRFLEDNYGGCSRFMREGDDPRLMVDDFGNWECRIILADGSIVTDWGKHHYEEGDLELKENWTAEAACFPSMENCNLF